MKDKLKENELLNCCLYFTLNKFTRRFNSMAEGIFKKTGLAPSYAFAVIEIDRTPGLRSTDLAKALELTPSTITRFIDKLIVKGLVKREVEGKNSRLYLTGEGRELLKIITPAWRELYDSYSDIIGEEEGKDLTSYLDKLADKF